MIEDKPLTSRMRSDGRAVSLQEYVAAGGYQGLRAALQLSGHQVIEQVAHSNLKGRGGAGFPTAKKWGLIPTDLARQPRYFVERRRDGARHDEGPPAHGGRSAPVDRGHDHRLVRRVRLRGVPVHPRGIPPEQRGDEAGHRRGVPGGLPGPKDPGQRLWPRPARAHLGRPVHVRRGDGHAQRPGG